ncbi:unnamed protein product [Rhizophagus irregularis]|nr:unnamed protein product [Rhizophagus irregularis]
MNFSIVCYCLFLMLSSSFWYLILDRAMLSLDLSFSLFTFFFKAQPAFHICHTIPLDCIFFTRTCFVRRSGRISAAIVSH